MPSMFGSSRKKNRAPAPPLTKETANPNAATAAASAFMARPSSSSLSSAAAAAALKARPTTPTNVAEVQSKRFMRRRSASVSSPGSRSASRDRSARELRRTPSNASMTERTFRSPSPGRSPAPVPHDYPPVPSMPKDVQIRAQRASYSHKSSASLNLSTQPFRTASQRVKDGQSQSSWFSGAHSQDGGRARKSDLILQSSPHNYDLRPSSPTSSINFSYPRASTESPSPTAPTGEPALIYDPNSRRMVPNANAAAMNRSQSIREASEKPVHKKQPSIVSRSGSHLSKGSVGRTQVAPAHIVQQSISQHTRAASSSPARPAAASQVAYRSDHQEPIGQKPEEEEVESDSDSNVDVTDFVAGGTDSANAEDLSRPALHKKPSLVKEEPELEAEGEAPNHTHVVDTVRVPSPQRAAAITTPEPPISREPVSEEKPAPPSVESSQRSTGRRARVHSESPARSARFASSTDKLVVRHEPPPRSLSPRKSALKQSNSARGVSPSDDSSEASGPRSTSNSKDEVARKKSFRVSFNDENNVVVGESAEPVETDTPILPSPQAVKKPWHSILSRSKKDSSSVEDEDETMSPRPALPLFGSVREKKTKETDGNERPLVRPSERAWSPPPVSSPLRQTDSPVAGAQGPSADAAIGAALVQDSASRHAANISRTREPLPPVVTSIEGTGYDSSSVMSTDDEIDDSSHVLISEPTESNLSTVAETTQEEPEDLQESQKLDPIRENGLSQEIEEPKRNGSAPRETEEPKTAVNVPVISIQTSTPQADEEAFVSPEREYFEVPGGFPGDDSSPVSDASPVIPQVAKPEAATVVAPAIAVAPAITSYAAMEPEEPTLTRDVELTPSIGAPMADIPEEGSDNSSIYSDAYEDISDAEGHGFMSLDAVLTAPADSKVSKLFEKTKRQSQEWSRAEDFATVDKSDPSRGNSNDTQNDWENAKAYWRSLPIDKRRQLEQEALEEAGEDADYETTKKQKKKTKKRRSTDRPVSGVGTSPVSSASDVSSERVYQIQPGTTWPNDSHQEAETPATVPVPQLAPVPAPKFRKSMRAEQAAPIETEQPASAMRKTLRTNGSASTPMPGEAITTSRATTTRPVSYHPPAASEPKRSTRRALSSEPRPTSSSGVRSSSMRPSVKRQDSDDSDSSFRRSRAGGNGFFRSSMRAASQEPESPATKGSGRFSLRSLSPTPSAAFRRGSFTAQAQQQKASPAPAMGGSMRTSMRTSLRSGPDQSKRSSRTGGMGFGRSPKTGKKGKGTRFDDSSDEEDSGRHHFSSRFADSSDEDDAPSALPARGGFARGSMRTHKRSNSAAATTRASAQARAESPDLIEESIAQAKRNGMTNGVTDRPGTLQRNRSGRGSMITSTAPGVLGTDGVGSRPAQPRRNSFMSSILRRKKDDTSKISRDLGESVARRDTQLERNPEQLNVIRTNGDQKPRLHKREPSWPLPDENDDDDGNNYELVTTPQRPATSAGPNTAAPVGAKPALLKRRTISHQGALPSLLPSEAGDVTPKKKKFGALRKMFRLGD